MFDLYLKCSIFIYFLKNVFNYFQKIHDVSMSFGIFLFLMAFLEILF